jgi:hypothetical protein
MLSKLGACPFNEVADLISIIRQQTSASIEAVQQAAARPPANGADKGEEIAH